MSHDGGELATTMATVFNKVRKFNLIKVASRQCEARESVSKGAGR